MQDQKKENSASASVLASLVWAGLFCVVSHLILICYLIEDATTSREGVKSPPPPSPPPPLISISHVYHPHMAYTQFKNENVYNDQQSCGISWKEVVHQWQIQGGLGGLCPLFGVFFFTKAKVYNVLNEYKICLKMLEIAILETPIIKNFWGACPQISLESSWCPPPLWKSWICPCTHMSYILGLHIQWVGWKNVEKWVREQKQ